MTLQRAFGLLVRTFKGLRKALKALIKALTSLTRAQGTLVRSSSAFLRIVPRDCRGSKAPLLYLLSLARARARRGPLAAGPPLAMALS